MSARTKRPIARRELVCIRAPGVRTSYTIRFRRTQYPSLSSTVQNTRIVFDMEQFAMRQQQSIPRACRLVVAAALLLLPVSASGQTGQLLGTTAAMQAAAAQPAEAVRRLSSDEAVRLALEQNLGIQIARINPGIQDVGIAQARSLWAPAVTSNLSRQRQTSPSTSSLSGGTNIQDTRFASSLGINQELPWGGSYTANGASKRVTTTNLVSR